MNSSKSSNGRVNIMNNTESPDISKLFAMYDKIPANQCATFREPTLGQWNETELSKAYFSKENIQIIQNGIRSGVFEKSNGQYLVSTQDCDTLKIIMRSVYLQHSANQPTNISGQIEQLNQIVLDYCIYHVYSEAQSYMKYLYDVSTLVVPLSNPVVETQKDKNNYLMPKWF
jgi:type 1 glutamine amidotransferase